MRATLLVLAAVLAAGCTGEPDITSCGLQFHAPARAIDEGWRYDVRPTTAAPVGVDVVRYRFLNATGLGTHTVFDGSLGELLASGGNRTLRFLDAREDALLGPGDAFVLRDHPALVLQLSRGSTLLGGSAGCT